METLILVDSDILIDAGRGDSQAVDFLDERRRQSTVGVSVITYMELLVGCRNKREAETIDRFLRQFQLLNVSEAISGRALSLLRQFRLSHGLLIPDALIAATAIVWEAPLASRNQRDYRFIPELHLLPYPA